MQAVATGNSALMRLGFQNRTHQQAVPIKNCQTFGILTRPQKPGKIASRVLHSESPIFFDSGDDLDAVGERDFSVYTFSVRNDQLTHLSELYELPDPTIAAAKPGSERAQSAEQMTAFRTMLQEILLRANSTHDANTAKALMDWDLPAMILRSWFNTPNSVPRPPSNRARVVGRAEEYLSAFPKEPLTVEELSGVCACSMSTLERAIAGHFGVTPKRYLLQLRLSGVRRALLSSDKSLSIAATANDWGFWHMGKFAADYRKTYGELPSKTRRSPLVSLSPPNTRQN
jgi:AraC family ethanolamine operon transcriptional activator